jgi:NDP-sugar pyrophosphorylase family protein
MEGVTGKSGTRVGSSVATGASVTIGSSVTTGSSVVTGSAVGLEGSDVSPGGGVVSSANAVIGNTMDEINENKRTIEKIVSFFVDFIVMAPSHP